MHAQVTKGFRLSPQQKRLWLLQQDSLAYRAHCALLLKGNLKVEVLREALQEIVSRHEILRTTFHRRPGIKIPIQVVHNKTELAWCYINLSNQRLEEQEAKVEADFYSITHRSFDFEQGPLFHVSLLTQSENKHILHISLPSLCADTWTLKNLVHEISQTYAACLNGEKLFTKPMQYLQFSEWQNKLQETNDADTGKAHWLDKDLSVLPELQLPFEKKSLGKSEFEPDSLVSVIEKGQLVKIETIAQKYDTSLAVCLFTCWQVLLGRLTQELDIVIGIACDGRAYEVLHSALGLFAKWMPIHFQCRENLQFGENLRLVDESMRSTLEWQDDFSMEQTTEEDGADVSSVVLPIGFEFEVRPSLHFGGNVSFSVYKQHTCIERFKVKLSCVQKENSLITEFRYDTNLFLAEDIKRLMGQFNTLLENVLDNPDAEIDDIEILSHDERKQLLVVFNQTKTEYPLDSCIHNMFEEQTTQTPDSIAVVFENQHLSYTQLNIRANQLAHHLQKLGVGPDVPVAISVERSLEVIVGMLGIFKAGGVYVPLDPVLPTERINFMLSDAQTQILLTQRQLVERFSVHKGKIICLDPSWDSFKTESKENPVNETMCENLVYIMYTSGSTGTPKGVGIEHQQLLNYLNGILERLSLPTNASFAMVSTFGQDLSNTAVFPSLCTGGRLHIVSQECASDPKALSDYFCHQPIDCLKIVPSHLDALLASAHLKYILPHQRLILGGEASNRNLIHKIHKQAPNCTIFNHYGPTETTIGVLTYQVEGTSTVGEDETIPIGQPIANTQVYLLNPHLQPVPIHVTGELYIGGAGLARGYLNHPDLTAERFIPHPFGNEPGARMYKTGDLARFLSDGNVEFLGRIDHQVKLRGYRIELGEIEAILSQHPAIQQTAVLVREDTPGTKCLVAYFVSSQEPMPNTNDLRRFVGERLPDYMVPQVFVKLDILPLTPNGKVDRSVLSAYKETWFDLETTFLTPNTPFEEILVEIWADVIGVKRVSITDNFFELGGHSLLATQLISRVRDAFRVEIPLRSLFEEPTIANLAKKIELAMYTKQELQSLPIVRVSRSKDCPLSFAQQRLWFIDQLEPGNPSYNIPRAIQFTGLLNMEAILQSFNEIVRRHEVLRTRFPAVEGLPASVIVPEQPLIPLVVDLSELTGTDRGVKIQRLATRDAQRTFDLAQGPLLRVALLRSDEAEHTLLFTVHHIVSDAWSTGVFIHEGVKLYEVFASGKTSTLTELSIQYVDFAYWQQQRMQGKVLETHLSYWKHQLGSNPPVLELPTDRPRPAVQSFKGASQSIQIPKSLSEGLNTLNKQEAVTPFMTILAAFQVLLHYYTSQDDLVIGTDITNRNKTEIEGLIGFFVNQLVLRTDLSGNPTFRDLLGRIRETTLDAYVYQDLPFEKLVDALKHERTLSYSPLFQIKIVFQNVPMPSIELPGLTLRSLEFGSKTAKFDLTLFIHDIDDGMLLLLEYNTDLFDNDTIIRLLSNFEIILNNVVTQPNVRINILEERLAEIESKQQIMKRRKHQMSNLEKLKKTRRKTVNLPKKELVEVGYLQPSGIIPVIQPEVKSVDLTDWVKSNREFIERKILHHGFLLFRGFNLNSPAAFEEFSLEICPDLFKDNGEHTPLTANGNVQIPIFYPPDKKLLWHNENSFNSNWPMKIMFHCEQTAQQGGETVLVDSRKVFQLIDSRIKSQFIEKQVMYVRNFSRELGLDWQTVFRTTNKAVAEAKCRKTGVDFEWKDGDNLKTISRRPAVAKHPKTGEMVWFNQAQHWHVSCLDKITRESLFSIFSEADLPRSCYYANGSPIEDVTMQEICRVYQNLEMNLSWQKGDVLVLDNMLIAHGRQPYVGERKILATMGEISFYE